MGIVFLPSVNLYDCWYAFRLLTDVWNLKLSDFSEKFGFVCCSRLEKYIKVLQMLFERERCFIMHKHAFLVQPMYKYGF